MSIAGESLARGIWSSGLYCTLDYGIVCDETHFSDMDGVYAGGDLARWHNGLLNRLLHLEHRTSAAEQEAVTARTALNSEAAKAYSTVPYFWSDWYDHRIQFVVVPQADEVVVDGELDSDRGVALP